MTLRRAVVVAAVVGTFVLASPLARANDAAAARAEAKELFRAGLAAYERHDYPAAALAFEEANRRAPNASTMINAARAWDDGGDLAKAGDDYSAALADPLLDASLRSFGSDRLQEIELRVGLLTVEAPAGSRVSAGRVTGGAPLRVHLAPGSYAVDAYLAGGAVLHRTWVSRPGIKETMVFTAPPPPVVVPPLLPPADEAPRSRPGGGLMVAGAVTGGVGVLVAITAVALGAAAVGAVDDYNRSEHTDASARSRAVGLRAATNIAWATAGVGAALGATLFSVGLIRRGEPSGRVIVSSRGVELRVFF